VENRSGSDRGSKVVSPTPSPARGSIMFDGINVMIIISLFFISRAISSARENESVFPAPVAVTGMTTSFQRESLANFELE
jgi:hypothetical protein